MSDENATPSVVPATNTAPAPAPVQARPAQPQPKPKRNIIEIPEAAFKHKVSRAAARLIQERLGITLEEAEAKVKAATAPGGVAATAATPGAVSTAVLDKLKRDLAKAVKDNAEAAVKHKKDLTRERDKRIVSDLKSIATSIGVKDTKYAIYLFAEHAAANQGADPTKFFSGLKTSHPYLFQVVTTPAAVEVVEEEATEEPASTAPPESQAPGEQKPTPASAAAKNPAADVESLDPKAFSSHMKSKYGYTPGM